MHQGITRPEPRATNGITFNPKSMNLSSKRLEDVLAPQTPGEMKRGLIFPSRLRCGDHEYLIAFSALPLRP
jgi:hypothetical protein